MSEPLAVEPEKLPAIEVERLPTTREKIILGGIGALTPILLNLIVIDLQGIFSNVTPVACIGYSVRVIALFCVGGLVAFLHKKENDSVRLIELGIIAPALLTSVINGANATRTHNQAPPPVQQRQVMSQPRSESPQFRIVSAAFAQQARYASFQDGSRSAQSAEQRVETFSPPEETAGEQFWRGLTGASSKRVWFVVVGSYRALENAERHAEEINRNRRGFTAKVYRSDNSPYFAVVIGNNLTLSDAVELKSKALSSGFPPDTYIIKPQASSGW